MKNTKIIKYNFHMVCLSKNDQREKEVGAYRTWKILNFEIG